MLLSEDVAERRGASGTMSLSEEVAPKGSSSSIPSFLPFFIQAGRQSVSHSVVIQSYWFIHFDSYSFNLIHLFMDSLIHWFSGSLIHWFIDSQFLWFIGSLIH
jgi:hypothetical protein